jgi:hypothetical protein
MLELLELKTGPQVRALVIADDVTIVAVEPHGDEIVNVVYGGAADRNGPVSQRKSRMAR